jgi:hypothetical protein
MTLETVIAEFNVSTENNVEALALFEERLPLIIQSALDAAAAHADRLLADADAAATAADRVQTGIDRTASGGFAVEAAASAAIVSGQAAGFLPCRAPNADFIQPIQYIKLGIDGSTPKIERIVYATGEQDDYTAPSRGLPVFHERAVYCRAPNADYTEELNSIKVSANGKLISVTYATGKEVYLGGVGPAQVDAPMGVQMGFDAALGKAFTMGPSAGNRDLVLSGCQGVWPVPSWPDIHLVVTNAPGRGLSTPFLINSDRYGRNPNSHPIITRAQSKILAVTLSMHQSDGMTYPAGSAAYARYRTPAHPNFLMLSNSKAGTRPDVAAGCTRNNLDYAQQVLAAEITDLQSAYNFLPTGYIHGDGRIEIALSEEYYEAAPILPAMAPKGFTRLGLGGIGPNSALRTPPSSVYRIIPTAGGDIGRDWTLRADFDQAMLAWKNQAAARGWGVYLSHVALWFSANGANDAATPALIQQIIAEVNADLQTFGHNLYTGQPSNPAYLGWYSATKFDELHPTGAQAWHQYEAVRQADAAGIGYYAMGADYGGLAVDGFGWTAGVADGLHQIPPGHAYAGFVAQKLLAWQTLGRPEKTFRVDYNHPDFTRTGDVITVPVIGGFAAGNPAMIDTVSISNRPGTINGWRYLVGGPGGTNNIASVAVAGGGNAYLITLTPGTGAGQLGYAEFGYVAAGAGTQNEQARGQCRRTNGFTSPIDSGQQIYFWLDPFRKAF